MWPRPRHVDYLRQTSALTYEDFLFQPDEEVFFFCRKEERHETFYHFR